MILPLWDQRKEEIMTIQETWIVAIFLITLMLWISASETIGRRISIE